MYMNIFISRLERGHTIYVIELAHGVVTLEDGKGNGAMVGGER